MKPIQIANLAWNKMTSYSFVADYHRESAIEDVIKQKNISEDVKNQAMEFLVVRHEQMKEAMKKLRECKEHYTSDNYQELLKDVGRLQKAPIEGV